MSTHAESIKIAARHHAVDAAGDGKAYEAIGNGQDDQCPDDRLCRRPVAAAQSDAAHDCRRQRGYFPPCTNVSADGRET